MLSATRTYVHYFGEDQVAELREKADLLALDWRQRRSFVDDERSRDAGDNRMTVLMAAIDLLGERVP